MEIHGIEHGPHLAQASAFYFLCVLFASAASENHT